jgi:hypothetical protein
MLAPKFLAVAGKLFDAREEVVPVSVELEVAVPA